ncbi:MAG: YwaF family protein [Clostridia bacterium]|nr:YwaF family protein [Clostridia bacterium]
MNYFEKFLHMLQAEMNTPKAFGWFHLMWIGITILALAILGKLRKKYSNKQLKIVLGVYGIIALILEVTKQIMWSFNYDAVKNIVTWDYQWYAAPFQLCTTPIFVSIICLFLKEGKLRNSLLSYMAFITILGGFITILIPDSCFVSDILINIHTMWLHCGSFVVSSYLIMSRVVKLEKQNLINAFKVFLCFVLIAEILNIGVYNMDILNGETFNMFYISPYFISTLPVFNVLQENLPFIIYLITYIIAICLGGTVVYGVSKIFLKKDKI